MNRVASLVSLMLISVFIGTAPGAAEELPDAETLRGWVAQMQASPRGPFKHLRWFCNDGTVQPPREYACREHGGGVQHGEWTERVQLMRTNGYYIANVFADIKPEIFLEDPLSPDILKQMILERFLMDADDGWIFRKARYYRGALQTEDETRGGRSLLIALINDSTWRDRRFIVLREAVRFFPHGRRGAPISAMRQLSLSINDQDPEFEALRIKIHVHPELSDADRVREYAEKQGIPELSDDYARLAKLIEAVFQAQDVGPEVLALSKKMKNPRLARRLQKDAGRLTASNDPSTRFAAAGRLLATLRVEMTGAGSGGNMLALMDTGLALEAELFRTGNTLLELMPGTPRRQRLIWLHNCVDGLFGIGLLSARQRNALQESFRSLDSAAPKLIDYKTELEYAARVPEWAGRNLRFHFSETEQRFETIEPLTRRYVPDRLRGSLLLVYSAMLESLVADANRMLGIHNDLFGQNVAAGLRGLNAGIARGVLRIPRSGETPRDFDRKAIYVLPATTEDLPPVAGIITAGKGNILSHVQLLARNLGIPNVAVVNDLLPEITAREGQKVLLAVSPSGIVQLVEDGPRWDGVLAEEKKSPDVLIRPDLNKLDLYQDGFIALENLRAADSGRVAGPKAANLGELKHHFPEAVTDGLVIPFGLFRALLDRPFEPGGPSVFGWMQAQYARIRSFKDSPQQQDEMVRQFLERIREWILNTDPGGEFRTRLEAAMEASFGRDGTYGVFVRSDTNVEDLPGFSGAGLNLTVPNVVGFENVLEAINRVWASPFTERAYHWRQAYMDQPEHVYVSVLLLKSVPSEKSGVMVTADVDTGKPGRLTIAVNEGVGGAVSGQTAEELQVDVENGRVRLMAQATEPFQRVISKEGGMAQIPASGTDAVLTPPEVDILIRFAAAVPQRFPALKDAAGNPVPADIEFGFHQNKLVLFQIRPFLESRQARQSLFLGRLDQHLQEKYSMIVDLDKIPEEEQ